MALLEQAKVWLGLGPINMKLPCRDTSAPGATSAKAMVIREVTSPEVSIKPE